MRRVILFILVCVVFLTGCQKKAKPEDISHVYLGGFYVQQDDLRWRESAVYVDSDVVAKTFGWLIIDREKNLSFKTMDERILQFPTSKDWVLKEKNRLSFNVSALAESMKWPTRYDPETKTLILGTFSNDGLAYADISREESVNEVPIVWDWPEDGIERVFLEKEPGRVLFRFLPTGEVLGEVAKNPESFPEADQIILDLKGEDLLIAKVKDPDPREQGEPPSDRSYSIQGIWSVLTSTKFPKNK